MSLEDEVKALRAQKRAQEASDRMATQQWRPFGGVTSSNFAPVVPQPEHLREMLEDAFRLASEPHYYYSWVFTGPDGVERVFGYSATESVSATPEGFHKGWNHGRSTHSGLVPVTLGYYRSGLLSSRHTVLPWISVDGTERKFISRYEGLQARHFSRRRCLAYGAQNGAYSKLFFDGQEYSSISAVVFPDGKMAGSQVASFHRAMLLGLLG